MWSCLSWLINRLSLLKKHPVNWNFTGPLKENYYYIRLRIGKKNNPDLTCKRSIYLIIILLGLFILQGYGQFTAIGGTLNDYASIETINGLKENDADSVTVTSLPPQFGVGDTVMVYCVKGSGIKLTDDEGEDKIGKATNPQYSGKYAFLIIDQIIGNTVVLNTTMLPEIGPLVEGEVAQLIRVPSYRSAEVTSKVTAPAWDEATGTGGVVALFVTTVLKLSANINVSGLGFKGAAETVDYAGACSSVDTVLYDSSFYHIGNVLAGKKGEGITNATFEHTRGKGRNINGGGGGNGRLSGGGGGSNYSSGGKGGNESGDCGPGVDAPGGVGGYALNRTGESFYRNRNEIVLPALNRWNRIFFGGGGGTGTRIPGRTTTAGTNGGGLVVIIADTIDGNGGNWIIADGNDVTSTATGAGGGGGGGGGIILDVSGYKNNPKLSAVGGDGGDTNHPSDTTGPGGGGGGGIYWLAGLNEPGVNTEELVNGNSGEHVPTSVNFGAANGGLPARKDGLEAPLRGFLFNSVPGEFWICSDQVPETIFASRPKGGDGVNYNYLWVDSSSTQNAWLPAPGINDGQHYAFVAPLSDTSYYRRIVTSATIVLPPDTSFRVAVYVHQAIENNVVAAPDTVCEGNAPVPFTSVGLPDKGIGVYSYRWVKDEGSGSYTDADGTNTGTGYAAPGLTETTHFARITYSGVCIDTSDALTVTVFEPITGNTIADHDTICWNTRPDLITGPVPGGGDVPDKRYKWESGPSTSGPWTEEAGITTLDYRPGQLTETTWYRRVTLSGSDDACVDFSPPVEILNTDIISDNNILSAEQTVCWFDQPGVLQGSDPGGGYQGLYAYTWESMTLSTGWTDADDTNGNDQKSYTPPVMAGDTTWFRRVVGSGGAARNVCTNTSDSVVIHVLPSITNNRVRTDVDVNCQDDLLADLTQDDTEGSTPGGGATQGGTDNTRKYKWEQATGMGAPGANWTQVSYGAAEIDFTGHPALTEEEDYWYRRIVFSGPDLGGQDQVCSDISDTIHITIHTAISNNILDAADSACHNTEKVLRGALPAGETGFSPSYAWRDVAGGAELGNDQNLPYTFATLDARQFIREVVIGMCENTSAPMEITVMELPGGTLSGDLPKACEKMIQLDVDLTMEEMTRFVTPWKVSLSDGVNTELLPPQALEADGTVDVDLNTDQLSTQYDYTIGRLVYRLTDGTECVAPPANLSGNVPIEVFLTPEPEITVETVLTDNAVCDNEISLVVDPDHGTGMWTSNYEDALGFLPAPGALSVRASIDPSDSLAWLNLPYTIYFYSEAGDCNGIDSVEISFFEQPESANAGVDDTIYLSNSTWLNANPATAGEGTWTVVSGSGTFEDDHDPKTFVYGLAKGDRNEFMWTIVNGVCITYDDNSVITQDRAQPYEGFSPNRDGINDYFIIRGLGDLTEGDEFSITFFNALGRRVQRITNENIDEVVYYDEAMIPGGLEDYEAVVWDGISENGNPVPSGTYYYVIRIVKYQEDGSIDKPEVKHYVVVSK
jgi:hypothetical protein